MSAHLKKNPVLRVVRVCPGGDPHPYEIANDLTAMQEVVGGDIESVPIGHGLTLVCNEEGRIKGLKPNRLARLFGTTPDIICGVFFITKEDPGTGEFLSVTDADVKWVEEYYS